MNHRNKILLVEDDHDLGSLLKLFLCKEGFEVVWNTDGKMAEEIVVNEAIDLCIYDVMLPGIDGFEIAKKVKAKLNDLPFLFLTAKKQKEDKLYGLKLGADDYISKPFEPEELILRIRNILKRTNSLKNAILKIGMYTLDIQNFHLKGPSFEKVLTEKETQLIAYFFQHKNSLVEKSKILEKIWGEDDYFMGRSMDVFISRLRKYFSEDPDIEIKNIRGVGFVFKVNSE